MTAYRGAAGAFNDVVVTPNGDAYATNTTDGSIWRARAGALSLFLPPGTVDEANGITAAPDGQTLYVAGWHDIHHIDIATRVVRPLAAPADVISASFDGLYWHGAGLIGIQNGLHPGRVVRLALDAAGTRITRAEILEQYHPRFGGMTTATIDGASLLYVLNTQSRAFDAEGRVTAGVTLHDIVIARLPL